MRKRVLCAVIISLIICCIGSIHIQAEGIDDSASSNISEKDGDIQAQNIEAVSVKDDLNIVFAVDYSGSMNQQDAQQLIPLLLKVFVDTMHDENIRIGYVAYTDTIIAQREPVSIWQESQREALKQTIESADYKGETDIGLGLREAYHLMDGCAGKKMIVLISDGETDLALSNTGRTESDSEQDIEETVALCKAEGTPIITIAFGGEYEGEETEIHSISSRTGGANYEAHVSEELVLILYDLFHTNFIYSVRAISSSVYDEGIQKINCGTDGISYDELTVLLYSDQEIEEAEITRGGNVIVSQIMGNYAVATLSGSEEELTIEVGTKQKQQMTVFLIGRRNITPVIEINGTIFKNQETEFKIHITDSNGNLIEDPEYFEKFQWQAHFQNPTDGIVVPVELETAENELIGHTIFDSSGNYRLYLDAGRYSENAYETPPIEVSNIAPNSKSGPVVELLTFSGEQTLNLDDYFEDMDGDALSYEILDMPQGVTSVNIEGNYLRVSPKRWGTGNIMLLVSDGQESLIGQIPVRVKSWIEAYPVILITVICLLLFIILKICWKKKKVAVVPDIREEKNKCYFTGKLNAYFTLLPTDMEEIPPLTFALHHIREGKIVIGDMFKNYPELSTVLELDHMLLYPAENRKIIFYHNSRASVMIGNSIVCRKMQYAITYGTVIYVTSQDGACELELHYISTV